MNRNRKVKRMGFGGYLALAGTVLALAAGGKFLYSRAKAVDALSRTPEYQTAIKAVRILEAENEGIPVEQKAATEAFWTCYDTWTNHSRAFSPWGSLTDRIAEAMGGRDMPASILQHQIAQRQAMEDAHAHPEKYQ